MSSTVEEDDYFLKWEKHHSAFVSFFSSLFRRGLLVDCTLAAEEKYIKAHRIVLMACSPYLEELLTDQCDNFPIVFLDIKFSELKSIVDFCYRGEVKIPYNELEGFLKAANMLQIRGLSDSKSKSERTPGAGRLKRRRSSVNNSGNDQVFSDGVGDSKSDECGDSESAKKKKKRSKEVTPPDLFQSLVKCELNPDEEEAQGSDNSDVDTDDDSDSSVVGDGNNVDVGEFLMQATGSLMFPWSCNRCGEAFSTRNQYQDHRRNCFEVPLDHFWKCEQCPNTYKNKKDLIRHLNYCGKNQPRLVCERCNRTYKYDRGLKRHQQYCGTDVKPLQCLECNKTYKYKRGLRRHQRRCAIFRALSFLQPQTGETVPIVHQSDAAVQSGPPPATQPRTPSEAAVLLEVAKEKRISLPKSPCMAHLVCGCGRVYKYEKAFLKHKHICSGTPPAGPEGAAASIAPAVSMDSKEEDPSIQDIPQDPPMETPPETPMEDTDQLEEEDQKPVITEDQK